MDITKAVAELKKEPGFTEKVGMLLIHNGVIRSTSRKSSGEVSSVNIKINHERMEEIRNEMEKRPGIFRVKVHAIEGELKPGDDALFLIVAGDFRENVKSTLSELLDRIKAESVMKQENMA